MGDVHSKTDTDQVQAFLLAMRSVHIEFLTARHKKGQRVEWLEGEDLGLPIHKTFSDWAPNNTY